MNLLGKLLDPLGIVLVFVAGFFGGMVAAPSLSECFPGAKSLIALVFGILSFCWAAAYTERQRKKKKNSNENEDSAKG
mgnify:CR=1 FL=1